MAFFKDTLIAKSGRRQREGSRSSDEARWQGITILLIEQFVNMALALADRCAIMVRGEVSWSGPAADAHQEVLHRYLGAADEASTQEITDWSFRPSAAAGENRCESRLARSIARTAHISKEPLASARHKGCDATGLNAR